MRVLSNVVDAWGPDDIRVGQNVTLSAVPFAPRPGTSLLSYGDLMVDFPRDAACIVGIGRSTYGSRGSLAGRGLSRLALDAIHDACNDAGLDVKDIDGFAGYCDDPTLPADLAVSLGTPELHYSGLVWGGRGSGIPGALSNAYMAVATGLADYVVVLRSIIQERRLGQSVAAGVGLGEAIPLAASYTAPFGMALPAAIYAMKARRHMALYGTTVEHLAAVAINARRNAANNPDARFRTQITVEEHHASRLIADPPETPRLLHGVRWGGRGDRHLARPGIRSASAPSADPGGRHER